MVVLDMKVGNEDKKLYMDSNLHFQLIKYIRPSVRLKDFDCVLVVDGAEGVGKSLLSFQIAKVLDPGFDLSHVALTPSDFVHKVNVAKPYSCVVFDEAFTGLSSRSSLSEVNQLLISMMMEMRQKNLFVIIAMPTVFMLDKYVVLHRARGLFHVYLNKGKRGYWEYFNKDRLKYLYINGKKYYSYSGAKKLFFGRFLDQYMLDEQAYRRAKFDALKAKDRKDFGNKYKFEADVLFSVLHSVYGKTQAQIVKDCKEYGLVIDRTTISKRIIAQKQAIIR